MISNMSLAEIKAELPKLTAAERAVLARELKNFEAFNDPELMERITQRLDEAERGEHVISKEEMYRRLREAGRKI